MSDNDNRKNKNKDRAWQRRSDIEAFFIPIIDNRGILPPTPNQRWSAADIVEILYGKRIRHISPATFDAIKNEATHYNCVDLVFSMVINNLPVPFLARLTMKNCAGSNTLLSRIVDGDFSVQEMSIQRQDYGYLNRIIGNQISGNGKKALLVGAGSLGGYVASELVKNGFNNITIYDGDYLEPDNFMRWPFGGIISRMNKAEALKFYLEHMHPEIKVNAQNEYFDADAISPQISDFDYIIFTVGSSDVQLKLNRVIKEKGITCCVLYAWLEAGGDYSHVLSVKYNNSGCFECLFTDEHGELINNKANMAKEEDVDKNMILNGCGGTRAAYGTAALLRTVSALLVLMKKIESTEISKNCLVNITPDSVTYDSTFFIEKRCRCCGNNAQ